MEIIFVILGFLVIFPLFWIGIINLTSRLFGWHSLANKYRTDYFPTDYVGWQSGQLNGLGNYNNILRVAIKSEGIYLGVFVLFKPGHPDLLIPWSEVSQVKKSNMFLFGEAYKLTFGNPSNGTMLLRAKLFAGYEDKLPFAY